MPGFDGTRPSDRVPISGKGRGFCVLKSPETNKNRLSGFAGLQGVTVDKIDENFKNPKGGD
jgi:hypothetical protein